MATATLTLGSQNRWLADGVTTIWNINFVGGYLSEDTVYAYSFETEEAARINHTIEFLSEFQIRISPAVSDGHTLVVYRDSSNGGLPRSDFTDGGGITEENLDLLAKQAIFVAQETEDFLGTLTEAAITARLLEVQAAAAEAELSAAAAVVDANSAAASAASATASQASATASAVSAALSEANVVDIASTVAATTAAYVETTVATAGQTDFPILHAPSYLNNIKVFIDGVRLVPSTDYSWPSSLVVRLATGAAAGQEVMIEYAVSVSTSALQSYASDKGAEFVGTEAGITLQAYLRGFLYASDLVVGQTTDNYTKLRAWLDKAKVGNGRLLLPTGIYGFSDTLLIDDCLEIVGPGRDVCQLNFINSSSGKPAIKFINGSAKSKMCGFTLTDNVFGTSTGIVLIDQAGAVGGPVWKNTFEALEIVGFQGSHVYTSASPLSGATHTHCSENRWINCRFANNVLVCLNQNCQAVNNFYIGCDFENFDTTYHGSSIVDSGWHFFKDEAGGGIQIIGGSLIGRGKWFEWEYKTGGTTLFSGGQFHAQGVRVEARSTHNGVCINEAVHGVTGSLSMNLAFRDIEVVTFGQSLDLLRYGGRLNFVFDNVNTIQGTGALTVRQYPTLGRTSGASTAAQGIGHMHATSADIVVETSSPYGTYNANATGLILRDGCLTSSTNASMAVDARGWFGVSGKGNSQQLGNQLNDGVMPQMLLWNNDTPGNTIAGDVKILVPVGGRPLELVVFKQPQAIAGDSGWECYVCKDEANWVTPGTFAIGTDATLVATTGVTTNKAGFFRVPVVLTAAGFTGTELRAGKTGWTEGRLYFKKTGGTAFPGWFGINYL